MTALETAPLALAAFILMTWALQLGLVVAAAVELCGVRRRDRHQLWRRVLSSPLAPTISVLVPAYNEERSVVETTAGMLALNYPNLEVVLVNDGSTDRTIDVLIERFELRPVQIAYRRVLATAPVRAIYRSSREPHLVVVDKENGGKADALNVALNVAAGSLVCSIDADTLVAPDALQELVWPFLSDPETIAVGGTVRPVNESHVRFGRLIRPRVPRRLLTGVQLVEYMRAFLIGRLGWNALGGNLVISGAFGLFRRPAVLEVGGYSDNSLGEDMELVVRLRRVWYERGRRALIVFLPDPVAWTEAPESIRTLARQRNRWHRGLLGVLVRHRRMIGRPRYGTAGLLALPYFIVVEVLTPVVEVLGLPVVIAGLALGAFGGGSLLVLAVAYSLGFALSLLVLVLDEVVYRSYPGLGNRLLLVVYAAMEHLWYRPLTIAWRLWGLHLFLRGRSEWGEQVRRGFAA